MSHDPAAELVRRARLARRVGGSSGLRTMDAMEAKEVVLAAFTARANAGGAGITTHPALL